MTHFTFLALVVLNLVGGFHALGTLMAVGIMILPAAAARFWAAQIGSLTAVAVGIALLSSVGGLLLSYHFSLPSGPAIILGAGLVYAISVVLGPVGSLAARVAVRTPSRSLMEGYLSMITRRVLLKSTAAVVPLTVLAPALAASDGPIRVVATFSILGDMVSRIGGEHVAVTTLVGPDGDTHVYRPTPAAARAVSEADVLVVNGLDFEGWLDRLIETANFDGVRVVATAGIDPITFEDDHGDDHDGDHDHEESKAAEDHGDEHEEHGDGHEDHAHGAFDPHAWQSLRHAVTYVDNVTLALANASPESREHVLREPRPLCGRDRGARRGDPQPARRGSRPRSYHRHIT